MPLFVIATVPALTSPDPPSVMPPLVINVRVLAAPTPSVPLRVSGTVSVRAKSPPVTTNEPRVVIWLLVPTRLTVPVEPDVLRNVTAMMVPPATSVMPALVARRSSTVPAFTTAPVLMPIVPALSVTFAAVSVLVTARLPVSTREKSPPVTTNDPSDAMAFVVPARLTVPVTPDVLCKTFVAVIVPVGFWVMPLPVVERSTVAADRMWPAFSAMPPLPDDSTSEVVAVTPPATLMVPVLTLLMDTFVAKTGPDTATFPAWPLSTSVKSPPVTWNLPSVPMSFAVLASETVPAAPVGLSNVPAMIVPDTVIPEVAVLRDTLPAPPSFTSPGIAIVSAARITVAALTVPVTLSRPVPSPTEALVPPFRRPLMVSALLFSNEKPVALNAPVSPIVLEGLLRDQVVPLPVKVPTFARKPVAPLSVMLPVALSVRVFVAAASNVAGMAMAPAVVVTTPPTVTAPTRMVPAVIPVRSLSDKPDAVPRVTVVPELNGANSNMPLVPAFAKLVAPKPATASACKPMVPPATDATVPPARMVMPEKCDVSR